MFLAFAQPLVRGWNRYFTWLEFKRTPRGVIGTHEKMPSGKAGRGNLRRRNYWSEDGVERNALLKSTFQLLEEEGWSYSADTGWKEWDIQIYGNFFWSVILQTVTEYHGGPKCLTRVRLRYRFVTTTVILNLLFLAMIIYRDLNSGSIDLRILIPYGIFLLFLWDARPALEAAGGRDRRRRRLSPRPATDREKGSRRCHSLGRRASGSRFPPRSSSSLPSSFRRLALCDDAGPVRGGRRALRDCVFRRGFIFRPSALRANDAHDFLERGHSPAPRRPPAHPGRRHLALPMGRGKSRTPASIPTSSRLTTTGWPRCGKSSPVGVRSTIAISAPSIRRERS